MSLTHPLRISAALHEDPVPEVDPDMEADPVKVEADVKDEVVAPKVEVVHGKLGSIQFHLTLGPFLSFSGPTLGPLLDLELVAD